MEIKVHQVKKYNTYKYRRSIVREDKVPFQRILTEKLEEEIDDRYYYEKSKLKESGIKFGSKEFKEHKELYKNNYFPPLDAPWSVRSAWRKLCESCPKEDRFELKALSMLLWEVIHDSNIEIKTNDIDGYFDLCKILIKRFRECDNTLEDALKNVHISLLERFNQELHKYKNSELPDCNLK